MAQDVACMGQHKVLVAEQQGKIPWSRWEDNNKEQSYIHWL